MKQLLASLMLYVLLCFFICIMLNVDAIEDTSMLDASMRAEHAVGT